LGINNQLQAPYHHLELALFGFVFSCPAKLDIVIISFHKRLYDDLAADKLALFFQLGLHPPEQVWEYTILALFGFVFSPDSVGKISINPYYDYTCVVFSFQQLALFFQVGSTGKAPDFLCPPLLEQAFY